MNELDKVKATVDAHLDGVVKPYMKPAPAVGLAFIGQVTKIGLIPGADFIVHASVDCGKDGGKWHGVVRKEEIKEGDLVEVYLPDSILPGAARFAFMEHKRYRVRQARFKGCPSTCLIMPIIPGFHPIEHPSSPPVGTDITEAVGVTKYEKAIPASLSGIARGNFPAFIPKTDEILYQKAQHLLDALAGKPYYITLKYDGCSGTAYHKDGHFGVCSRNLELKEEGGSVWWEMAKKYNLQEPISNISPLRNIAVQFEVVGPGVQGNPVGLQEREIRVFDIFDIDEGRYFAPTAVRAFCANHGVPIVDLIAEGDAFGLLEDSFVGLAEAVKYANGKPAEGIVIRAQTPRMVGADRLSFKVINLNYKD